MKWINILFVAIFLMIASPFNTLAEDIDENKVEQEKCYSEQELSHMHKAMRVHIDYYYELLINKYRPELMEDWKESVRDRDAILKKIKELSKEGADLTSLQPTEQWKTKHEEYQESFLEAIKNRDNEKIKTILPLFLQLQQMWNDSQRESLQRINDNN
ncbi:hypothetical protein [Evansella cellulosilytica]|uniref:Uncharacterized protein n=1 Tax=Evansella cellulosilytica (strain ATCC 21833 / DSM 2522 / FERM P-1141 / JCM 9156 / N-4) TaxID=649639 RepID=E6TXS4_EVAC2|nr:hypothetical protein [Evansella cellulosilytica]ADU30000.1 hypothetical protein Bcell_1737 [Evansella cellulosilytica DSM 2522]